VHLALGRSYTFIGGQNESSIHWDIVKDLRTRGRMYADGRLVQEDGRWIGV
jgi:aminopeptidase